MGVILPENTTIYMNVGFEGTLLSVLSIRCAQRKSDPNLGLTVKIKGSIP